MCTLVCALVGSLLGALAVVVVVVCGRWLWRACVSGWLRVLACEGARRRYTHASRAGSSPASNHQRHPTAPITHLIHGCGVISHIRHRLVGGPAPVAAEGSAKHLRVGGRAGGQARERGGRLEPGGAGGGGAACLEAAIWVPRHTFPASASVATALKHRGTHPPYRSQWGRTTAATTNRCTAPQHHSTTTLPLAN